MWSYTQADFKLENSLFEVIKFFACRNILILININILAMILGLMYVEVLYGSGFGKNVTIFGADMSSSAKKRNILTIKTDLNS